MALSVAQYAEVNDWETRAASPAKPINSVAWSSGDAIVVVVLTYDGTVTSTSVTNANLTFTQQVAVTTGGSAESYAYLYTAIAGSLGCHRGADGVRQRVGRPDRGGVFQDGVGRVVVHLRPRRLQRHQEQDDRHRVGNSYGAS
jgi:hypothetical protein